MLERAPELGEVGAGFAMTRNAVTPFRGLGFGETEVDALSCTTRAEGTWQADGRPMLTIREDTGTRVALIGVHRRRLRCTWTPPAPGSPGP